MGNELAGIIPEPVLVLALYFSVVGVLLSVFLGGNNIPMFFMGVLAGSAACGFPGDPVLEDDE